MGKKQKIFFSGIGGSGVSALASFMAGLGHEVIGSDRSFDLDPSHPAYAPLKAAGVKIVPQDGSGISPDLDLVVFSTAVELDRPEPRKAAELGVPMKTRPEFLAELVAQHKTYAVAGTSGKSTTSGMLAFLMHELGLSPSFIGGGRVRQFRERGGIGNALTGSSDRLVVEACESDGSIVNYKPEFTLLLNLDLDHHSIEKTAKMFRALERNTAQKVILNADDAHLMSLELKGAATFGIDQPADYRAERLSLFPLGAEFELRGVKFRLAMPGRYNVYNALACLAVLAEAGVDLNDCVKPLLAFRGVDRRFDVHLDAPFGFVMDDYAHNPHKLASMMQMAQMIRPSVTYVFQPHGFAPTRMMKKEYIESFAAHLRPSDRLVLLPIFYAGGTVAKDISSQDIADGVRALGGHASVLDRETLVSSARKGECYVICGARDETLSDLAERLAKKIESAASLASPCDCAAAP